MKNVNLTNEDLGKQFSDRFQMTNFAIQVARDYIKNEEDLLNDGSLKSILEEVSKKAKERNA